MDADNPGYDIAKYSEYSDLTQFVPGRSPVISLTLLPPYPAFSPPAQMSSPLAHTGEKVTFDKYTFIQQSADP